MKKNYDVWAVTYFTSGIFLVPIYFQLFIWLETLPFFSEIIHFLLPKELDITTFSALGGLLGGFILLCLLIFISALIIGEICSRIYPMFFSKADST